MDGPLSKYMICRHARIPKQFQLKFIMDNVNKTCSYFHFVITLTYINILTKIKLYQLPPRLSHVMVYFKTNCHDTMVYVRTNLPHTMVYLSTILRHTMVYLKTSLHDGMVYLRELTSMMPWYTSELNYLIPWYTSKLNYIIPWYTSELNYLIAWCMYVIILFLHLLKSIHNMFYKTT